MGLHKSNPRVGDQHPYQHHSPTSPLSQSLIKNIGVVLNYQKAYHAKNVAEISGGVKVYVSSATKHQAPV